MAAFELTPKILDIASDNDPFLRIRAAEVDTTNIAENIYIQQVVVDMVATMHDAKGIGLAAPQIRQSLRIMVFYLPAARDDVHGQGVPLTVLINPVLSFPTDEYEKVTDYEGCLSVPGMRGRVARARKLVYSGVNQLGEPVSREAEGWHARLIQHEFDHLEGILYTDLMNEDETLLTVEEWRALQPQPAPTKQ